MIPLPETALPKQSYHQFIILSLDMRSSSYWELLQCGCVQSKPSNDIIFTSAHQRRSCWLFRDYQRFLWRVFEVAITPFQRSLKFFQSACWSFVSWFLISASKLNQTSSTQSHSITTNHLVKVLPLFTEVSIISVFFPFDRKTNRGKPWTKNLQKCSG